MHRVLSRRALGLLAAIAALGACTPAPPANAAKARAAACRPVRVLEIPLRQERNFLLAAATLDGQPTTLLIDTGAETTTLTPEIAASLRLPADTGHPGTIVGITGTVPSANVVLGRLALGNVVLTTAHSVGVGALPSLEGIEPPVAGLLGVDVLADYEVELDLPGRRMALYAQHPCAGYVPWQDAISVPFQRTHSGLAFIDARVNGRTVRALLDTGARTSLLTRQTARAVGVTERMLASDEARTGSGVGSASVAFRHHRFASLGLPGALDADMAANVGDVRLPGADMLLGADYVGRRRVWISYATGRLFLR